MKLITNGKIVLEDKILEEHSILVKDDTIVDIIRDQDIDMANVSDVINAYGGYITPGFIDIHADYIEHMAAPRSKSVMDMELAVYEFEKECCTHGITTMFHSVSMMQDGMGSPLREIQNIKRLVDVIEKSHSQLHLIHHRLHMRYEIDNFEQFGLLRDYIEDNKIHLLSFMDHTPGQGQYSNIKVYKDYMKHDKKMNDDEVDKEVESKIKAPKLTLDQIEETAKLAISKGIAIASHDDDTVEKLDIVKSFGTNISEFPINITVAKEAKNRGMYTVVGAPNILLGGSHSGNMSAKEAIDEGCADILCSDYYPAALLHSIFNMKNNGSTMEEMVAKVTINPARAVGISDVTGSIEKGKKADILIITTLPNKLPAITHVLVDGKVIQQNHYRV